MMDRAVLVVLAVLRPQRERMVQQVLLAVDMARQAVPGLPEAVAEEAVAVITDQAVLEGTVHLIHSSAEQVQVVQQARLAESRVLVQVPEAVVAEELTLLVEMVVLVAVSIH